MRWSDGEREAREGEIPVSAGQRAADEEGLGGRAEGVSPEVEKGVNERNNGSGISTKGLRYE